MRHVGKPLFVYGTMLDRDVIEVVLGRPFDPASMRPAWLDGYRVVRFRNDIYPMLVEAPGEHASGAVLYDLDATDLDRIGFFESYEYDFIECTVEVKERGRVQAVRFGAAEEPPRQPEPWDLAWWQREHKDRFLYYTRQFMAFYGRGTLEQAEARWLELERDDEHRVARRRDPVPAS